MSTSSKISVSDANPLNEDVEKGQFGIESSRDSSDSSNSSSGSDDESSESTGSSSDDQRETSVERSEGEVEKAADSDNSTGSYKSLNTSRLRSASGKVVDTSNLNTSVSVVVKGVVGAAEASNPAVAKLNTGKILDPEPLSTSNNVAPASPVQVTPAKSLVFASPTKQEIDFSQIEDDTNASKRIAKQPPSVVVEPEGVVIPGDVLEQGADGQRTASTSKLSGPESALKRTRESSKASKKDRRSPEVKRKRGKDGKASKVKSRKSKSVERMEKKMRFLQSQLNEVRESGVGRKKRSKKEKKKHKSSKSKNKTQLSSDSGSSASSEKPTTSARISKISTSRKLQGLAMARAKQLGTIKQGEVESVEVVEALKVLGDTKFPVEPTQSYRDFHRVPGTGLEHIVHHLKELQDDIEVYVGVSAKLHLELAREHDLAKRQRIGPEADNEWFRLWQFSNDLIRATAITEQPISTPDRSQVAGSSSTTPVVKSGDGGRNHNEHDKAAIGSHDASGADDKIKSARKRKAGVD